MVGLKGFPVGLPRVETGLPELSYLLAIISQSPPEVVCCQVMMKPPEGVAIILGFYFSTAVSVCGFFSDPILAPEISMI